MSAKVILNKLEITNYRLCKNTVFTPTELLTVLIGPNGSGKTTILRTLSLLRLLTIDNSYSNWPVNKEIKAEDPIHLKVHLQVGDKKIVHNCKIQIDNDDANNDTIIASEEIWNLSSIIGSNKKINIPISAFDSDSPWRGVRIPYHIIKSTSAGKSIRKIGSLRMSNAYNKILENKDIQNILTEVAKFYRGINYYSASKFTNPSLCPVSFEYEEDSIRPRRLDAQGHQKWLVDMYKEWKANSDNYNSYIDIIGKDGIGLIDGLDFKEVDVSNINYSVRVGGRLLQKNRTTKLIIPQININNSILSPSQLSEGTFKTLGMLFYIMTNKGSILLLEEPEVCIHYGLLSSIMSLIKNRSAEEQIFVSTHSDYILDFLIPDEVHVVQKNLKDGITVTALNSYLSKMDKKALTAFLKSEGSLGEYWRTGAIEE